MFTNRGFARSLFVALLLGSAVLLYCSCEGPRGSAGISTDDLDMTPPEISLLAPTPSDTVYTDTFTVYANADDDESVSYVDFFVNSSNDLGGDRGIARDSFPPYTLNWSFSDAELGYGIFPIIARAVDASQNESDTPPILIIHLPPPLRELLQYDYYESMENYYSGKVIPNEYYDRYYNVRFSPLTTCKILEVRIEFFDRLEVPEGSTELTDYCNFRMFFWTSDGILPDVLVDSFEVSPDTLGDFSKELEENWTIINVRDRENLEFSGDFHVGFSPVSETYEQDLAEDRGMIILCSVDQLSRYKDPDTNRSSEYWENFDVDPNPWGTLHDHQGAEDRFDLHIRALVRYVTGETALLNLSDDEMINSVPGSREVVFQDNRSHRH